MNANRNFPGRFGAIVLGALLALGSTAFAQALNCDPTNPKPYGPDFRNVSRNITGFIGNAAGGAGYVTFYKCQTNGERTRYIYREPINIDLSAIAGCDEVPELKGQLRGYYYSEMRIDDPFTANPTQNPKIGWHYGFGDIIDPTTGQKIASASFRGTIGTNSSRPPLPEVPVIAGTPSATCYVCEHHTGLMQITFVNTPGTTVATLGTIQAFYQFDGIHSGSLPCDSVAPCDIFMSFQAGTLDGINRRRCQ